LKSHRNSGISLKITCITFAQYLSAVSFETPIIYQFPLQLPTDLFSVIIQAKDMISKSKLS